MSSLSRDWLIESYDRRMQSLAFRGIVYNLYLCEDSETKSILATSNEVNDTATTTDCIGYEVFRQVDGSYAACLEYGDEHVHDAILIMIGSDVEKQLLRQIGYRANVTESTCFRGCYISRGILVYSNNRECNNNIFAHSVPGFCTTVKSWIPSVIVYLTSEETGKRHRLSIPYSEIEHGRDIYVRLDDGIDHVVRPGEYLDIVLDKSYIHETIVPVQNDYFAMFVFLTAVGDSMLPIDSFKNKIHVDYSYVIWVWARKTNIAALKNQLKIYTIGGDVVNAGLSELLQYKMSKRERCKQAEVKRKQNNNSISSSVAATTAEAAVQANSSSSAPSSSSSAPSSSSIPMSIIFKKHANKNKFTSRKDVSLFLPVSTRSIIGIQFGFETTQNCTNSKIYKDVELVTKPDSIGYLDLRNVGNFNNAGKYTMILPSCAFSHCPPSTGNISTLWHHLRPFCEPASWTENGNRARPYVVVNNVPRRARLNRDLSATVYLAIVAAIKSQLPFVECFVLVSRLDHITMLCINTIDCIVMNKGLIRELPEVFVSRREIESLVFVNDFFYDLDYRTRVSNETSSQAAYRRLQVLINEDIVAKTNEYILSCADDAYLSSQSAIGLSLYPGFTPPAKINVMLRGIRSVVDNIDNMPFAYLMNKRIQVFADPVRAGEDDYATLFVRRRLKSPWVAKNCYLIRSTFGDIDGMNSEDAFIVDRDYDFQLTCVYQFNITFSVSPPDNCRLVFNRQPLSFVNNKLVVAVGSACLFPGSSVQFNTFSRMEYCWIDDRTFILYVNLADEAVLAKCKECSSNLSAMDVQTKCKSTIQTNKETFYVHSSLTFTSAGFDGMKLYTLAGQKGLVRRVKDIRARTGVDVVVNNNTLFNRKPIVDILQLERHFPRVHNGIKSGLVAFMVVYANMSTFCAPGRLDLLYKSVMRSHGLIKTINQLLSRDVDNPRNVVVTPKCRKVLQLLLFYSNIGIVFEGQTIADLISDGDVLSNDIPNLLEEFRQLVAMMRSDKVRK